VLFQLPQKDNSQQQKQLTTTIYNYRKNMKANSKSDCTHVASTNSYWTQLSCVVVSRIFAIHGGWNKNARNFSNGVASLANVLDGDFEGGVAVAPEPGSFRHVEPGRSLPSMKHERGNAG
jgi:hypothetical protein